MYYTVIKKFQFQYTAQAWQQTLIKREIAKNNYRVTKNIRIANAFVSQVSEFTFSNKETLAKEFIIFSNDLLEVPLEHLYAFSYAIME